ncbi:MAG: DUF805 domain-containing protein [Xanthomonadales bacterium]|jgi:uncharacterized membrane protein YhaH (DUF805 family)|nr:DUF805 domain-containing protein [Xanthomonadales bacterium]
MQEQNPYRAPSASFNASAFDEAYDETPPFSPAGRFGRLSYLAWSLVLGFVGGISMAVFMPVMFSLDATDADILAGMTSGGMLLAMIPMFVLGAIFGIRRLHDINKSGWWLLLFIVPIVNLILGLVLTFMPGSDGANDFGPPRETRVWEKIFAWLYIALIVLGIVAQVAMIGVLSSQGL